MTKVACKEGRKEGRHEFGLRSERERVNKSEREERDTETNGHSDGAS